MRNLFEQSCSAEDEAVDSARKMDRSRINESFIDSRTSQDLPNRWYELGSEDKLVLVGIGVLLFAFFLVAIVAGGLFRA
ncbi:hypothetical protein VN12_26845 [Pirellula sp. SH-Sr6A]|uniref:hypothetical protein n=1 Tax=Pirellula sp. SH-Sr6A TaxID=1632865 RepID=UPI00078CB217|nr:hypothetical protein [Pirellula sp. SH-Sr6A]AMV35740.1 hypothetical protein VN12_26845 [Pirellula sp. SH-Sr6A]